MSLNLLWNKFFCKFSLENKTYQSKTFCFANLNRKVLSQFVSKYFLPIYIYLSATPLFSSTNKALTLPQRNHDPSNIVSMDKRERWEARNFLRQISGDYWNSLIALHDSAIDEMTRFVLVAAGFDETITEHGRFDNTSHGDENLKAGDSVNICGACQRFD